MSDQHPADRGLYDAALPHDAPGAWIRAAIDARAAATDAGYTGPARPAHAAAVTQAAAALARLAYADWPAVAVDHVAARACELAVVTLEALLDGPPQRAAEAIDALAVLLDDEADQR